MNGGTTEPFLKQEIHSLFNTNKLHNVGHIRVKRYVFFFSHVFRKLSSSSTLGEELGGEGVPSALTLEAPV